MMLTLPNLLTLSRIIAVPLLVGLGFPGMAAVMAGMIIQSTPVSFGALGTPILVGVNTGLSADPAIAEYAAGLGYPDSAFLPEQQRRQPHRPVR